MVPPQLPPAPRLPTGTRTITAPINDIITWCGLDTHTTWGHPITRDYIDQAINNPERIHLRPHHDTAALPEAMWTIREHLFRIADIATGTTTTGIPVVRIHFDGTTAIAHDIHALYAAWHRGGPATITVTGYPTAATKGPRTPPTPLIGDTPHAPITKPRPGVPCPGALRPALTGTPPPLPPIAPRWWLYHNAEAGTYRVQPVRKNAHTKTVTPPRTTSTLPEALAILRDVGGVVAVYTNITSLIDAAPWAWEHDQLIITPAPVGSVPPGTISESTAPLAPVRIRVNLDGNRYRTTRNDNTSLNTKKSRLFNTLREALDDIAARFPDRDVTIVTFTPSIRAARLAIRNAYGFAVHKAQGTTDADIPDAVIATDASVHCGRGTPARSAVVAAVYQDEDVKVVVVPWTGHTCSTSAETYAVTVAMRCGVPGGTIWTDNMATVDLFAEWMDKAVLSDEASCAKEFAARLKLNPSHALTRTMTERLRRRQFTIRHVKAHQGDESVPGRLNALCDQLARAVTSSSSVQAEEVYALAERLVAAQFPEGTTFGGFLRYSRVFTKERVPVGFEEVEQVA